MHRVNLLDEISGVQRSLPEEGLIEDVRAIYYIYLMRLSILYTKLKVNKIDSI